MMEFHNRERNVASPWNLSRLDSQKAAELRPETLFTLAGKVAVVTGAGGGIGAWLSAGLAAAGAAVLLTDHPGTPTTDTADAIRAAGGKAEELACDLLREDAAELVVEAAMSRLGGIDILVNNAGVNRREPIFEVSRQSWDLIAALNLRVPYELSRAAAKRMAAGAGGAIVHIGSLTNAIGLQGVSVYGAHKAAICQLAKSMAVEWAGYKIRVNAICPGFMLTPLSKPLWDDPVRGGWILERSLLKRPGYPEELIGCLLLLVSPAGSFITGQSIYVDGGWLAGTPWTPDSDGEQSGRS
jgi:NAD(P)-dependent dehydrogenase (short-subunit alcohol dehydrogenase family)